MSVLKVRDNGSWSTLPPGKGFHRKNNAWVPFGASPSEPTETVWSQVKIGAGGFISGIDISPGGEQMVIRTDTHGGYRWDAGEDKWVHLIDAQTLPAEDVEPYMGRGMYAIAIAPSNPNRLYTAWRQGFYRSDNGGEAWVKQQTFDWNRLPTDDNWRTYHRKMVVDPINPDHVIAGTSNGAIYRTTNGGSIWTMISDIPASGNAGYTGLVFDSSSGATDGHTSVIYAHLGDTGYYRSTDGGVSWASIGGVTGVVLSAQTANGNLYISGGTWGGEGIFRYDGSSWTQLLNHPDAQLGALAIAPQNPNLMVAESLGGQLSISINGGSSWGSWINANNRHRESSDDIPWLEWTSEDWFSTAQMCFDPVVAGKLWVAQGIGVWHTTITGGMTEVNWTAQSRGIEQMVTSDIISPPGGVPIAAFWDRPIFRIDNPDQYPLRHYPDSSFDTAWSLDYSAADPLFIAANTSSHLGTLFGSPVPIKAGYSTDGGQNWVQFSSQPAGAQYVDDYRGGSIAVGDTNNIVWSGHNAWPYHTGNRGNSWSPVSINDMTQGSTDLTGFNWSYHLKRQHLASDRVTLNTMYLFYAGGSSHSAGFYRSVNGGANWNRVYTVDGSSPSAFTWASAGFNVEIKAVPGYAGHLFYTAGHASGVTAHGFARTLDGGTTWNDVPNVTSVFKFGFGKAAVSSSYPTIFIAGYVNSEYGIWRSIDNCATWTKIGQYPDNNVDAIAALTGDMNTFGTVYIGYAGSSLAYGRLV